MISLVRQLMRNNRGEIPFLDLAGAHAELREELNLAWKSVLAHAHFVGGAEVDRFEAEFAAYCRARACVGVANGTDALELILVASGIGGGDEVIVPANTFVATAEAVCAVGARPRFVDVDPDTLLVNPDAVGAAINRRTAAVIGVHLFGQMVNVHQIAALADRYSLAFIEDAAQAHGARFAGSRAGSVGAAAAFSFYPGKNLGALGDGGAVVTNDPELAARVRRLANHGRSATNRHWHDLRGRNSRLDSLQAAMLSVKLARLDIDNARRRSVMQQYRAGLPASCPLVALARDAEPVYHLAVIQTAQRALLCDVLSEAGIGWGMHYPTPCHQQPAFSEFHERLPVVERAAEQILSLPLFPTMRDVDIARVCDVVRGALS